MSEEVIPTEEEMANRQPDKNRVVDRAETEGYRLELNIVSETAVDTVEAFTYSKKFGMYRILGGHDGLANQLDEIVQSIASDQSILAGLQRTPNASYEVVAEVQDGIVQTNVAFDGGSDAIVEVAPSSEYVDSIDELFDEVRANVDSA